MESPYISFFMKKAIKELDLKILCKLSTIMLPYVGQGFG